MTPEELAKVEAVTNHLIGLVSAKHDDDFWGQLFWESETDRNVWATVDPAASCYGTCPGMPRISEVFIDDKNGVVLGRLRK